MAGNRDGAVCIHRRELGERGVGGEEVGADTPSSLWCLAREGRPNRAATEHQSSGSKFSAKRPEDRLMKRTISHAPVGHCCDNRNTRDKNRVKGVSKCDAALRLPANAGRPESTFLVRQAGAARPPLEHLAIPNIE